MEHRLLERKSASISSVVCSRDPLVEKPCPHSFNIEFRSTISLCVGILFVSIFLFCSLDPGKVLEQQASLNPHYGLRFAPSFTFGSRFLQSQSDDPSALPATGPLGTGVEPAMQGMGTLFRKGSQEMSELIVAHVAENMSLSDFRLFLRTLHRSGATAKADVILLYDSLSAGMMGIMQEEEMSFQELLAQSEGLLGTAAVTEAVNSSSVGEFNVAAFWKNDDPNEVRVVGEQETNVTITLPRWGSIIGFEMQELDPDNALKGFLDMPSVQLRRWLCYQMLLGVVKSRYKHVMLTEIEGVIMIGDALSAIRKKNHIYLSSEDRLWSDVEKVEKTTSNGNGNVRTRKILLEVEDNEGINAAVGEGLEESQDLVVQANLKRSDDKVELVTRGGGRLKETGDKSVVVVPEDVGKRKAKKSDSRRRSSRKGRGSKGGSGQEKAKSLIEIIYGREVWNSLDKFEKSRNVVSSGVIMGEIKLMRPLTNKMATEIVRVALERQDRKPFHDKAILNYLVCKSSVLGRKTLDRLRVMGNKDSVVHSLRGTKQKNLFWRGKTVRYSVVHGHRDDIQEKGHAEIVHKVVQSDICKMKFSSVYVDCSLYANDTTNNK